MKLEDIGFQSMISSQGGREWMGAIGAIAATLYIGREALMTALSRTSASSRAYRASPHILSTSNYSMVASKSGPVLRYWDGHGLRQYVVEKLKPLSEYEEDRSIDFVEIAAPRRWGDAAQEGESSSLDPSDREAFEAWYEDIRKAGFSIVQVPGRYDDGTNNIGDYVLVRTRCAVHDDCREIPELGESCWNDAGGSAGGHPRRG